MIVTVHGVMMDIISSSRLFLRINCGVGFLAYNNKYIIVLSSSRYKHACT